MKTLIAGTSYLSDESRCELAGLWLRVARSLNPGMDILVVDSASPFDPANYLDCEIFRFDDNIGAISRHQKDGSGRAFCKALEVGIARGYDYCAFIETDLILAVQVSPVVQRMAKSAVRVCSPLASPYQFPEWGVSFWDLEYVRASKFIERYGWEKAPARPIAEWRVLRLVESDYWQLPIHGRRNEDNALNYANIANAFPYQNCAWLHHCQEMDLLHRMLDLNGVQVT